MAGDDFSSIEICQNFTNGIMKNITNKYKLFIDYYIVFFESSLNGTPVINIKRSADQ